MEDTGMVIDTSIFIDFLRSKEKQNTSLFKISDSERIYISSITLYELLMGANNDQKRKDVQILTEDTIVLPFDENISYKAAEIYHQLRSSNKLIEFRDIFIAATCLTYDLPIYTLNKKHFERISHLKLK